MKLKFFFFVFILFSSLSVLQAQKKIAYVIQIDSIIKYAHFGMTSFSNYTAIYSLPFDLNTYGADATVSAFEEEGIELIKIDDEVFQDLVDKKKTLSKKEFKSYRNAWIEKLKKEYQIDLFMVVRSHILDAHQQVNMATELGQLAFLHENNQTHIRVFIEMNTDIYWQGKIKTIKGKTEYLKKHDFPGLRSKTTRYTEEEIGLLEPVLEELISLQLSEIKESKGYLKLIE